MGLVWINITYDNKQTKELGVAMAGPLSPSKIWHALSLNSNRLACKGAASIFFTSTFAIWKCRNGFFYSDSRASQTKVKIYLTLTELLSASLSRTEKFFSGRPLQEFRHFLSVLPQSKFSLLGAQLLSCFLSFLYSDLLGFPVVGLLAICFSPL